MVHAKAMKSTLYLVTVLLCACISSADKPSGRDGGVPACKDKFPAKCKLWESRGECESSRDYMHTVCPRACGVCLPASQVSGCEDQHRSCSGWGSRGECNKRPTYMNTYCPKTCNACPPTEPSECVDQHDLCFIGAMLGECTSNPSFYRTFCAHSCRHVMPNICAQDKSAIQEVCAHQFDCGHKYNIHGNRTRRSKSYKEEMIPPPPFENREEYARRLEMATSVLIELGEEKTTIEYAMNDLVDILKLPNNSKIIDDIINDIGINRNMSTEIMTALSAKEKAEVVKSYMKKDISQSSREGRLLDNFSIDANFCSTNAATGTLLVDLGLNWCAAAAALLLLVGPAAVAAHQNNIKQQAAKYKEPPRLPLHEINHPYGSHFGVYPAPPETGPVEIYKPVDPAPIPAQAYKPVAPAPAPVQTYKPVAPAPAPVQTYEPAAPAAAPVEALKTLETTTASGAIVNEESDILLDVDVLLSEEKNVALSNTVDDSSVAELSDEPTKREITYHPSIKALVPFCTIQGYLDLVKRLNPLVGEDTGRPLTPLAASLALAINYCQYGAGSPDILNNVPLAPEEFKMQPAFNIITNNFQKPQPPKHWPGISFPSLNEFGVSATISNPTTEAMPLVLMLLFNNSVVATNDTNMDGVKVNVDDDIVEALEKDILSKPQTDEIDSEANGESLASNKEPSEPKKVSILDNATTKKSDSASKVSALNKKNTNTQEDNSSSIDEPSLEKKTQHITGKKKTDKVASDVSSQSKSGDGSFGFTIDGMDFKSDILEDINLHIGDDFAVDDISAFGGFGTRRTGRQHRFKRPSVYQHPKRYSHAYDYGGHYGSWQSSYKYAEERHDEIADQSASEDVQTFACGGAPITPYHILTAAHCVFNDGSLPKILHLGETFHSEVQDVTVHPEYRFPERYNDLAIITLKQKMEFSNYLHPYCLPSEPLDSKAHIFSISGWGAANQGLAEILANVNVSLISQRECSSRYMLKEDQNPAFTTQYPQGISQKLVCAAYQGDAICRGDSGGPLISSDSVGQQQVVGIASATGGSCTKDRHPIIYTNVQQYYDWIDTVVYGGCDVL